MEITQAVGDAEKLRTELLVVGIFAGGPLVGAARAVDHATNGMLSAIIQRGELGDAPGAMLLVQDLPGTAAIRILLVSLGKAKDFSKEAYRQALAETARALADGIASEAVVTLAENDVPGRSLAWAVQQAGRLLATGAAGVARSGPQALAPNRPNLGIRSILLLIPKTLTSDLIRALRQGRAVAEGIALAEEIDNLPGDISAVASLAGAARAMGEEFQFDTEILERAALETPGRGAVPAAGGGTLDGPGLIVMQYKGRSAKNRSIVLAGAGIAFNMVGAGSVLGALKTVARLRLPINVVGLIAATGIQRDDDVGRRGDVLASMPLQETGSSDPDTEARWLLADALAFAKRLDPACVIDIATVTNPATAPDICANDLFANDSVLATELLKCDDDSGDSAWRLHLWDDRDLARHGSDEFAAARVPGGGVAKTYSWAHLDVSRRTASANPTNESGRCPVPLLAEFLIHRATELVCNVGRARRLKSS